MAEKVERLLAYLLGIVPRLEHAALAQVVPNVVEFLHQFVGILTRLPVVVHLRQGSRLQHLEDEDGVMGGQTATCLGDDVRMLETVLVGRIDKGRYNVIHIFLYRVVHRAFAVAGAGTVVVHPHAAASIDELDVEAHLMELLIELRRLAQGVLDAAYLGNLAADVEMNQFQAVHHILLLEEVKGFEQFARCQAELAGVTTTLFPLATATRSQLDTDTNVRTHLELLGHFSDEVQFVQFLNDEEDALTHFLGQQSQLDEALVLVAVAHHERVGVGIDGNDSMQFGLRACLQTEVELLAVVDHLFHNGTHLVHLDGINDEVLTLVTILFGCFLETTRHLLNAVVQYVGKAHQHGSRHIAQLELVDQFFQIDLHTILTRSYYNMPFLVDTKVGSAPTSNVVQLFRIFNTPFSHSSVT